MILLADRLDRIVWDENLQRFYYLKDTTIQIPNSGCLRHLDIFIIKNATPV
jgi:hypothetical protein